MRFETFALALAVIACGSKDENVVGPKFTPIMNSDGGYGGEGGEPDYYGGEGGFAGSDVAAPAPTDTSSPAPAPAPTPSSDPPPPAPVNAPGCGADGSACCVNGGACSDNLAQCCNECSGSPDYTCHCSTDYRPSGLCRVCCVACNNGKGKGSPLYVAASSCQEAAQAWCKSHFNVGADPKSGWRAQCG